MDGWAYLVSQMADHAAASAAANLCVKNFFGTMVEYTDKKKKKNKQTVGKWKE